MLASAKLVPLWASSIIHHLFLLVGHYFDSAPNWLVGLAQSASLRLSSSLCLPNRSFGLLERILGVNACLPLFWHSHQSHTPSHANRMSLITSFKGGCLHVNWRLFSEQVNFLLERIVWLLLVSEWIIVDVWFVHWEPLISWILVSRVRSWGLLKELRRSSHRWHSVTYCWAHPFFCTCRRFRFIINWTKVLQSQFIWKSDIQIDILYLIIMALTVSE